MSDETPMSKIQTLLVDYWSILKPQRPHLALSLIGGAKNFKMEGRKKEIFKNGLISAAKSTNALILTGGNNIGKLVLGHSLITLTKFWQILTTYPLSKSLERSPAVGDFYGTRIEIWAGFGPVRQLLRPVFSCFHVQKKILKNFRW